MEWLNVTAEAGLGGLFMASFLASTVLPGGSEAVLWAFLQRYPEHLASALLLATAANTAGGMTSWYCGRFLPQRQKAAVLQHRETIARWGSPALLFSWLPVVGDALCLAAGWLRLHWLPCCLFMAVGKLLRYAVVALAV